MIDRISLESQEIHKIRPLSSLSRAKSCCYHPRDHFPHWTSYLLSFPSISSCRHLHNPFSQTHSDVPGASVVIGEGGLKQNGILASWIHMSTMWRKKTRGFATKTCIPHDLRPSRLWRYMWMVHAWWEGVLYNAHRTIQQILWPPAKSVTSSSQEEIDCVAMLHL